MMCGSTFKILSLACTQFVGIYWITRTVHIAADARKRSDLDKRKRAECVEIQNLFEHEIFFIVNEGDIPSYQVEQLIWDAHTGDLMCPTC